MDKTAKIILGLAISIIYPVLVVIAVAQIIPSSEQTSKYPEYPRCTPDYSSYDYDYNYDDDYKDGCEDERKEHEQKVKEYEKAQNVDTVNRSIAALVIGVFTVLAVYFIRDVRELAGGITAGACLIIFGATSVLAITSFHSDLSALIAVLILITFGVLTYVLRMVDAHIANESIEVAIAEPEIKNNE